MVIWYDYKTNKPLIGVEVIAYHHKWINEDFNPTGQRVGFLNGDGDFTSAYWWDDQDDYISIYKSKCDDNPHFYVNHIDNTEPEYWVEMPKFSDTKAKRY